MLMLRFFNVAGLLVFLSVVTLSAGTLSGSFTAIPQGANINLTVAGSIDWVHWGLQSDSSINRKTGVSPQISDFKVVYNTNFSYAAAYRYTDNFNGYSWMDGFAANSVTNTTTGVYVVGPYNITETNGFEITVPADTAVKTLRVYVGAYAARGNFLASLSDSSAPSYSNNSGVFNFRNGPGGFYEVAFAADSPGQILKVRWTVTSKQQVDGNVTLQAAALSANGVNNPPYINLTNPAPNAIFSAPSELSLRVNFGDADGFVTNVAYYNHNTFLGNGVSNNNYALSWTAPAGAHRLTARVTDNAGATRSSSPVEIFGHTTGGTLSGTRSCAPGTMDLTVEGTRDWMHWGLTNSTSLNRKASVTPQISNFNKLGTNALLAFFDGATGFNWSDGSPTLSASNSRSGVFIYGITNGFELTIPAQTNERTLKIYVSLYGAQGKFQAHLSDFSAPAFVDTSLSNFFGSSYAVYTLNYAAVSSNRNLIVRFTSNALFDEDFGNVALAAATLTGDVMEPVLAIFDLRRVGNDFVFSFPSQNGVTYSIQCLESLGSGGWQTVTNLVGNGADLSVTNAVVGAEKFYRIVRP